MSAITKIYHAELRLRSGKPEDFKTEKSENNWIFKHRVIFFYRNAAGEFCGPFITGQNYDAFFVKDLLDEKNIFVVD